MAPFVSHKGNFGLWRPPCAKGTFGPLPQRNPVLTAGSTRTPGYNLCGPRLGMEAGKGLGVSTPGCCQTHPLLLPDPSSSLPQVGPFHSPTSHSLCTLTWALWCLQIGVQSQLLLVYGNGEAVLHDALCDS